MVMAKTSKYHSAGFLFVIYSSPLALPLNFGFSAVVLSRAFLSQSRIKTLAPSEINLFAVAYSAYCTSDHNSFTLKIFINTHQILLFEIENFSSVHLCSKAVNGDRTLKLY
jgi:hypothetical protein